MEQQEFSDIINELASSYALEMVVDPDAHMDAVDCIKGDYIEGAYAAYKLLTGKEL